MKKVIAILLILAMFTGCSPGGKSEKKPETPAPVKTVRNTQFGVAYVEEKNFDPIMTKNKVNLEMYGLVYEGLFELDENFAVKNLLCESYTNSGTSYKFKLKRGVTFSDGSPLTAGDVVFSIRRAMRPESFYAARLTNISGVYEDGGDVAVTLKRYNANLPRLLDIPVIKESSADTKVALGTGGYAVMLDTKTKTYYLAARSGWHQDKKLPYTRINMVKTAGIDQLIFNFESANIGIVTVDPTAPNPLQLRGEYETREYATTALVYLGFNTRRAPFGNSVVRQAIACAIDRKSAVELDFARMADETHLPIHSSCEAYDEGAARNFDYSTVNALAFLEKAAYKDENGDGKVDSGGKLSFEILVNAENKSRAALARRIASNLGDLGFTVSVREEKWENYDKSLKSGDFDMYIAEVNMMGDFGLDALLSRDGALNYGRYSSDTMEKQISAYNGVTLARGAVTAAFYRNFVIEAPIAPILFKRHNAITHRDFFRKISPTQRNTYYNFSDWEAMG